METPEKSDEATLPVLTPKTAGGSQRVIKQIMVIDPNKLRLAGLDVKMAEALKKSKKKSQPKSKESKLAVAKNLLNKKLKEAILKKDSAKAKSSSPKTPQKSVSSIEEAVRILSSSEKGNSKPKISVTNLKSLMPPPSFPVSSLISPTQTVEIKVLKSEKTKQSIEVKIVDSSGETPPKTDIFPKASLKSPRKTNTDKTQSVSPENKIEATKKLANLEDANEPEVSAQPKKDISQTVIVYIEEKNNTQKPRKGSDHNEYLTNAVEPSKNKSPKVVHWEFPPNEEKSSNEKNTPPVATNQEVVGAHTLFEMAPPTITRTETLLNTPGSSLKTTTSTPIRRESLPKVIESKVLKPDEKIDLSILTKKSPAALTVPKKRYKLDQNWITSESNQSESVYINLPPEPNATPTPKPVAQESAVDFINNLSLFFAESPANKTHNKSVPDILTKECGEDATSFLVSLFQKKHDSPKSQSPLLEENEGRNAAPKKAQCTTNNFQIEQTISTQDSSPETSSDTTQNQGSDIRKENKTSKDIQPVKTVHETTLDGSQSSLILESKKQSIRDNKSKIFTSEKDNTSLEPTEPIEPPSDLNKTVSNEILLSAQEVTRLPDVSSGLTAQITSVNEAVQESVNKLSTPPVSTRRKAAKPIPVLIPKLKKSRKLPTTVLKPSEDTIPQKPTEKPKEESPTQPVQNKEAFNQSIPNELPPFETEEVRKEFSHENTDIPISIAESPTSSMLSLASKNVVENFDELPAACKTERPQRQRKISVKLIESCEFPGVLNRTIEQIIKKPKETTTTPSERPQRQRKISFKLSNSSESNTQDTTGKIELATTTGRPQRQRKLSLKLLETSGSLGQVKNRTVGQEIKDKLQLKKNTENTSSVAMEVENETLKDPIAELVAFHETVEQFEMDCGSSKPKSTQNTSSNLESEAHSLSEYPFHNAICSEISSDQVQPNTPTTSQENVSGEKNSKKVLRKRKDSLRSRTFAGEQISIVSSDSLDVPVHTPDNIENVPSKKETCKPKDTPSVCQFESEEAQEIFESTPKHTETKVHARNLVSEMVQNEDKFSLESKEILNNSEALGDLKDSPSFSIPPQSTNIETPINTSGKKRRGRPPKAKKHFPNLIGWKKNAETSQPITSNSSIQPTTAQIGGSCETLASTDENYIQEITQVEVVEKLAEVNETNQPKTIVISKTSNLGGSCETLPSTGEVLSQEVIKESASQSTKKQRGKSRLISSFSLKSGANEDNVEKIHDVNRIIEKNPNKEEKVSVNAAINIGFSDTESRTAEHQSCKKHSSPKKSVIVENNALVKVSELEQIDEPELVAETLQLKSSEHWKTSQIKSGDTLEPSQASETGTEVVKLPGKSIDSETLCTDSSAIHIARGISQISDKQSMPKDDIPNKLKLPKPESKVNESNHHTDSPKTKEIVPQFEDLMFDLDHIESPSFSPICDSSRISNDSDRFEEFTADFTSALINTVTEAENSAEKSVSLDESTVEKSLNSPDLVAEKDSKPTQKLKSSFLENTQSDNVKQSPDKSSEIPKPTESPIFVVVKKSSDLQSSSFVTEVPVCLNAPVVVADNINKDSKPTEKLESSLLEDTKSDNVKPSPDKSSGNPKLIESQKSVVVKESSIITEDPDCDKDKPSSSFNISVKTLKDHESLDQKNRGDTKKKEEEISSDKVNSHDNVETSDKAKETQKLNLDKKKSSNEKPNAVLNSSDLVKETQKIPKITQDSKSENIEKSSDLYAAIHNKSEKKETRKNKAKNPFKIQKSKGSDGESGTRSQSDFLGFNEEEIEKGQQSTSLRLSQSEDAESLNIDSPSTSKIKLKHNIKESQSSCGRKQKVEQQKWEKNSAKSLQNWLSKPVKSSSIEDICDIKEKDTKEQSSSVPPKKRQSKVQNLTESIPLKKDVEHLEEEINNSHISIKSVDVSLIEESNNSSDRKEKPKRGRKPKLKNVSKVEQSLSEGVANSKEDINSLLSTPIIEKPKKGRKSKVNNDDVDDDEFKTPRRNSRSKISDQSIGTTVKKAQSENLPTPIKARGRKRKRTVSEENTPTTAEPPCKAAHLDGDSNIFSTARKQGRPKKSEVHGPSAVTVANVSIEETTPKQKIYKDDTEFNPRLLLIRTKEELKSNEPLVDPNLQTEPTLPDDVQCALCMGYTPKKKWVQHVSTHYGIGWIVGKPPPLNINSRRSVLSFLLEFYKVSKVKGLNCRLCNSLRRSALGLLGHLEQCCLTDEEINNTRIVCEYCKKNYTKSSYLVHKRTCTDYLKQVLEEARAENISEETEGKPTNDVLSNTGRFKRKAVIKAETMLKKLEVETTEFSPDDLIKCIPKKDIQSIESIKEKWQMDINSFGKGFCASKICRFTAADLDDLIDHYQDTVCPYYEKAGYFCVRCKFHSENIDLVRSHVIEKHSPKPSRQKNDSDAEFDSSESSESVSTGDDEAESESGGVEEVDENGERKPKRKKKAKPRRRRFHTKNPPTKEYKKLLPDRSHCIHEIVAQFYDKFIVTNYSLDPLFTFAKTNPIRIEASESYFPKSANSIKFIHNGFNGFVKSLGSSKVQPDQWKQLQRLHGMTENCEYTIYMGGPVKNIAWVPLDPHPPSNTQYLAVTVRKGLDKFTRFINQKFSRSLIFILKFDINLPSEIKADIIYAVAIDEGPIHAIEFLPSGGYSPEMNRLGILAVGTIETEIKIYSLPIGVENLDCDIFPIIRLQPVIELHLEVLDNPSDKTNMYSSQCICLLWSQAAGHNIIFGSFLNGFVGIWDISDNSDNLNRCNLKEIKKFTPVSYFWTSEDRLMHMALHYDMNGPRWLAISNSTRKMMLYDLRDITQPILFRVEVTINIINCLEWPLAWENIMFGLGDTMPSNGCVVSAFSPISIMFQTRRFEKFCSGVSDLHFNIWRNCVAAGTDNGDVQVTPVREAVLDVAQRLKIDEKIISTLDIVPFNDESISQNGIQIPSDGLRVFDKDHKDQYGIVFGSIQKIKGCNKPDYYNTKRVPPLNLQRLTRVSKIRFNQNKNACDVLAIGYNNGLLRVRIHDWIKKG